MSGPGGKEVGRLSLKVVPDTSDFDKELKAFAERVEETVKIELKVHLDPESVTQELSLLQAKMDAANLELDIDIDTAAAMLEMQRAMAWMQTKARTNPVTVHMDVDSGKAIAQFAATTTAMQTASNGSGYMGRQIALWGPLIFIAAAAIAAIGPALAALFPLLAGIGLMVGSIALGWKQLKSVFKPIVTAFKEMRAEIGKTLTAGLAPLIKTFVADFIPVMKTGLVAFAGLFNTALSGLLGFLNSTEGLALMKTMVDALAKAFEPFAALLAPLTEVFMRLVVAAAPALQMMGEALLRVTNQFATFLEKGSATDVITESMANLGEILRVLGSFGGDIFPSLFAAAPAVIAFVDGMLESLGGLFQILKPVFDFMSKHTGTMAVLGAVLGTLAIGIAVVTAATAAFNLVLALNPISLIVIAIAALIAGLVYAYNHFETFRLIVDRVWANIKLAVQLAWTVIKTVVMAGVAFVMAHINTIRAIIGVVRGAFNAARDAVSTAIGKIVQFVKDLPGKAVDALGDLSETLYNKGKQLIQGFIDGIKAMAGKVGKAAKSVLGAVGKFVPGSPVKEGPLRVFNNGRTGRLLMEMLASGIEHGARDVNAAMDTVSGDLSAQMNVTPTFDGRVAAAAIQANSNATENTWQEMQVTNWATGQVMVRQVSREEVEAKSFLNSVDQRLGVPT